MQYAVYHLIHDVVPEGTGIPDPRCQEIIVVFFPEFVGVDFIPADCGDDRTTIGGGTLVREKYHTAEY
jgi:hypothetical protein